MTVDSGAGKLYSIHNRSIHNVFLVFGRLISEPRLGAFPHRGVRPKAIVQALYTLVTRLVFFQGEDHNH
jgi:hypothetical protein